jgi:hypothetical protein
MAAGATAVHYVNDVLRDMNTFGTGDYNFGDHAKHWSELKGFALWMQFNPRSPLSDADFASIHEHLGMAPVLPSASASEVSDYRVSLIAARGLLAEAYSFAPENIGDDNGEDGW